MALHRKVKRGGIGDRMLSVNPLYARGGESTDVPKFRLPDGLCSLKRPARSSAMS